MRDVYLADDLDSVFSVGRIVFCSVLNFQSTQTLCTFCFPFYSADSAFYRYKYYRVRTNDIDWKPELLRSIHKWKKWLIEGKFGQIKNCHKYGRYIL